MAEPNLQKGSTDPAVRDLQEALKALGYSPGPIDGVFGATTDQARAVAEAIAREAFHNVSYFDGSFDQFKAEARP